MTEKKLISNDWLTSTYKKDFELLIERKEQAFQILPIKENEDDFDSTHLDVISSKIRWLYQNSQKYKEKVDELLNEVEDEIVFLFLTLRNLKDQKRKDILVH